MGVLPDFTVSNILLTCGVAGLVHTVFRVVYNFYFHPLARFPGPKLRAAFEVQHNWNVYKGDIVYAWLALHEEYGDFVRVAPNMISVTDPDAWRDIYGHGSKTPIPKEYDFYFAGANGIATIISSNDTDHTRMRRLLNHAFSDQALRSQEHIIQGYISLFISKLHEKASQNVPVDISAHFNFATFDILGDLCFGESFHALDKGGYNDWIATIFAGIKIIRYVKVLRAYPMIGVPAMLLLKLFPRVEATRHRHRRFAEEKTQQRIDRETDRKDFMSYILTHSATPSKGMTRPEIDRNSAILIIAGSETSATLLSGALFHLLRNPSWLAKLTDEIRSTFASDADITFTSTASKLPILNAVIMETFRLYPPVPAFLPRCTEKGGEGARVCGKYIPPGTIVNIPQYPANRLERNFKHAGLYKPERFLGDKEYEDDRRSALQPFSVGPRNCIGQNMAWSEIRTILARFLWHFDVELVDKNLSDWDHQKVFVLWNKVPLMVRLSAREVE
ncbi:cytochrome P450 monooxygenase-like protein [Periconia macrospinosa]|uniref:Cytochrome P450 monooxygenase-like protein n=1 Tax=Periconia macrospinosa TaxID=97972 RepID=A0A2V1DRE8_9PLEO|nr:cytochrome P450 monooxygenase-like protein [Periconia macrospinosa]